MAYVVYFSEQAKTELATIKRSGDKVRLRCLAALPLWPKVRHHLRTQRPLPQHKKLGYPLQSAHDLLSTENHKNHKITNHTLFASYWHVSRSPLILQLCRQQYRGKKTQPFCCYPTAPEVMDSFTPHLVLL